MFEKIVRFIQGLDVTSISNERIMQLDQLAAAIENLEKSTKEVKLNFICTHNSRRSHLSQVWAQTLAHYYKLDRVTCFSGGTEATAVFPAVLETLTDVGFGVEKQNDLANPKYHILYSDIETPIVAFSKCIDDAHNPVKDFIAVMTCTQADEACPAVRGASYRIALPFEDPKAFDAAPNKMEKYAERSTQIATELKYVFSTLSKKA